MTHPRTSWRGGVRCTAPCKGRSPRCQRAPDASRAGQRARRPPTHPDHPVRSGARVPGQARGAGIARSPTLTHSVLHHTPRRGFKEPKWTPWRRQPHGHRPRAPTPGTARSRSWLFPEDGSAPGAEALATPAPPSRDPTRSQGRLRDNPGPRSCPLRWRGPGTHRAGGGGAPAGQWTDRQSDALKDQRTLGQGDWAGRGRGARGEEWKLRLAGAGGRVLACQAVDPLLAVDPGLTPARAD